MERVSDRAIEIINELHTERLDYNSEYLPLIDAAQKLDDLETILGGYSIDRLHELIEADRKGRCVVLPCYIGDPVFMGMGRSKITGYEEDICDGFYIGRDGVLQVKSQCLKGNHGTYGVIGQSAELTSEAAKAALEKMKEREEK